VVPVCGGVCIDLRAEAGGVVPYAMITIFDRSSIKIIIITRVERVESEGQQPLPPRHGHGHIERPIAVDRSRRASFWGGGPPLLEHEGLCEGEEGGQQVLASGSEAEGRKGSS
jgi:hypothetical protein